MLGLGLRVGTVASVLARLALPPVVPPPAVLKPIGRLGTNFDPFNQTSYVGRMTAYLDHTKAAQQDGTATPNWSNNAVVAADGLPTSADGGVTSILVPIDNPSFRTDIAVPTRYAITSTFPLGTVVLENWTVVSSSVDAKGNNRTVGDIDLSRFVNPGSAPTAMHLTVGGLGSFPRNVGSDFISVVRLDEEADYNAGKVWRKEQTAVSRTGPRRYMSLCGVTKFDGDITTMAQWNKPGYFSWMPRMPIEALCADANAAGQAPWFNIPHAFTDDGVRQMVRIIEANLDPTLPYVLEDSNEVWGGGEYAHAREFFYNIGYPMAPGLSPIPSNFVNYGYRTSQMMAVARDESKNPARVRPYMAGWQADVTMLKGAIVGYQQWLADISDPTNTNPMTPGKAAYNAKFAALYHADTGLLGELFWGMGGAPYMSCGVNGQMSSADLDIVRGWMNNGEAGKAAFFDQIQNGGHLSVEPDYVISNFSAQNAPHKALALQHQIQLVAYECGQYRGDAPIADAAVDAWVRSLRPDPRTRTTQRNYFAKILAPQNYDVAMQFTDCNEIGADSGILDDLWKLDSQKYLGLLDVANNPPAPAALTLTLSRTGRLAVDQSVLLTADVRGGTGMKKLVWSGLPAGLTADNFRSARGKLTTEGAFHATVYAVDEAGNKSPTVTLDDTVGPKITGFRFVKVAPLTTNDDRPVGQAYSRIGSAEFVFRNADGSVIPTTSARALANFTSNNPAPRVIDGATSYSFITDTTEQDGVIIIDFGQGAAVNPKLLDVWGVPELFGSSFGTCDVYVAPDSASLAGTPDFAAVNAGAGFALEAHVTAKMTYSGGSSGYSRVTLNS